MSAALAAGGNTDNLALCDGIASRLRADTALSSGARPDDPLTALSAGPEPYLEVARQPVLQGRQHEVFVLPASSLHALVNTRGALNCRTFLFFTSEPGKPSGLLPSVSGSDDPLCYNTSGHLARVSGTDAYLEFASGLTNYRYTLRIVPWRDGRWTEGCAVAADFKSTYRTSHTFVRPGGPLEADATRDLAAQLAEAWSTTDDPELFEFGPAWPAFMNDRVRELHRLGSALGTMPVPTFGAPLATLGPFYRELEDADAYPIFVGGQVYLAQVGHATIGWRVFQDSILIIYTLAEGRLSPMASAVVEQDQGALESVRVLGDSRSR